MTHTLDIGTDLDDLLASIGDLAGTPATVAVQTPAAGTVTPERPALVNPRVFRAAWYR